MTKRAVDRGILCCGGSHAGVEHNLKIHGPKYHMDDLQKKMQDLEDMENAMREKLLKEQNDKLLADQYDEE